MGVVQSTVVAAPGAAKRGAGRNRISRGLGKRPPLGHPSAGDGARTTPAVRRPFRTVARGRRHSWEPDEWHWLFYDRRPRSSEFWLSTEAPPLTEKKADSVKSPSVKPVKNRPCFFEIPPFIFRLGGISRRGRRRCFVDYCCRAGCLTDRTCLRTWCYPRV